MCLESIDYFETSSHSTQSHKISKLLAGLRWIGGSSILTRAVPVEDILPRVGPFEVLDHLQMLLLSIKGLAHLFADGPVMDGQEHLTNAK